MISFLTGFLVCGCFIAAHRKPEPFVSATAARVTAIGLLFFVTGRFASVTSQKSSVTDDFPTVTSHFAVVTDDLAPVTILNDMLSERLFLGVYRYNYLFILIK